MFDWVLAAVKEPACQAPRVEVCAVVPDAAQKVMIAPGVLSVAQVPVVSPGTNRK